MKQAIILVNSKNKKSNFSNRLIDVCRILSKKEYETKIHLTKNGHDLVDIAKNNLDVDLIVVAGGDGTMNEVTNALGDNDKKPKIMYFPTGTVNDFGTSLNIPNNFDKQLSILRKHETRLVDSGRVNDMFFNYICAFGPFTRASYLTPHSEKNKFGKFAYYRRIVEDIPMISKSYELDIDVDGEKIHGKFAFGLIINSTSIGGFKHFMKHDSIDDGYFNLVLVNAANANSFRKGIKYLIQGMKDNVREEDFIFKKFKKLKIKTDSKIAWTMDGERGPTGSVEIEVLKHNLEIIAP